MYICKSWLIYHQIDLDACGKFTIGFRRGDSIQIIPLNFKKCSGKEILLDAYEKMFF